jgi:hypothetical protein
MSQNAPSEMRLHGTKNDTCALQKMTLQNVVMSENYVKLMFERLGGIDAVCQQLSDLGHQLKPATARMWIYRGVVPWRWRFVLLSIAAKRGVQDEITLLFPERAFGDAA